METINFTKMEGLGNDYILIEDWDGVIKDPCSLSKEISDRHFGVGGDGIILLRNASDKKREDGPEKRYKMRMFNSDGSESEMCGNGVRLFAKFVFDSPRLFPSPKEGEDWSLEVETLAGIIVTRQIQTHEEGTKKIQRGERVSRIEVDMGIPQVHPEEKILVEGKEYDITCASMGNPHCIIFVNDFQFDYQSLGKKIESHQRFPARTNVEFVQKVSESEVNLRVWERGSGETMACGTGSCATVAVCALKKVTGTNVRVNLKGGSLKIEWKEDNHIYMTGPATTVFTGIYKPK